MKLSYEDKKKIIKLRSNGLIFLTQFTFMSQSVGVKIKKVIKILKIVHRINRASLCFTHQHLVTRKPSLHIKNHLIGFTQQSG